MPIQIQIDEVARKIDETYQGIYEQEKKRLEFQVKEVESHFKRNPLKFDDKNIVEEIDKFKKEMNKSYLYKDHIQIHDEEVKFMKKQRAILQRIIRKYKIDLTEKIPFKKGEKTCQKAKEDYSCFQKFKANKFFDEGFTSAKEKKAVEAERIVNEVIDGQLLQDELVLLGRLIQKYLNPKQIQQAFTHRKQTFFKIDFYSDANKMEKTVIEKIDDPEMG